MFFKRALWMFGVAMYFESMRRGALGGSALSLFVIKEFGLDRQAVPTLNFLRTALDVEEKMIAQIPWFFEWLLTPITDYHQAAKTFVDILAILAELQRPSGCDYYWKKGERS